MTTIRRRPTERVTSALWGALVAGVGALMIARFNGYAVDLELAGIIALVALGGWLVLSAVLAGKPRERAPITTAPITTAPVTTAPISTAPVAQPATSPKRVAPKK